MDEAYSPGGEPPAGEASRSAEFNRSLLRAIHEASPDGILVVDENAIVVTVNRRFLEVWQLSPEQVRPERHDDNTLQDQPILSAATDLVKDPDTFLARVQALYADHHADDHCEIELKDGRTIERHSKGLHGEDGTYLGRVWFFRDISERKRAEAALRELAWRDPLTGLLNRRHFCERATEELLRADRYGLSFCLLMLDLDYFKRINDRFGHAGGDAVLEAVSERWRTSLRVIDLLARFGGEEFAVLLPNTDLEGGLILAERLRACISDDPVSVGAGAIRCTVSIGIASLHPNDRRIEDMLRRADEALYRAKGMGRNRVEAESPPAPDASPA